MPFKANADRRHRIPKQRRRITNGAEYDAALRQRGSLTVWFTEAAIAAWHAEPRTTPGGQPHYSALAITTALTLKAVFRLALRQTEGLIGSVIRLLGLDLSVPDHTTLSRRAETLEVPRPRSGSPDTGREAEPVHLLVDSTGLKLCGAGEWLVEKHGTRRRAGPGARCTSGWMPTRAGSSPLRSPATMGMTALRLAPCSTRSQAQWPPSQATARTTRTASTPASASAIPRRPSSSHHVRPPCPARRPRRPPPSATATFSSSPRGAGWAGTRRPDTRSGLAPRPPWAGSSA